MTENFPNRIGNLSRLGEYSAPAFYHGPSAGGHRWLAFPIGPLDTLDEFPMQMLLQCLSDKGLIVLSNMLIETALARGKGSLIDQAMAQKAAEDGSNE